MLKMSCLAAAAMAALLAGCASPTALDFPLGPAPNSPVEAGPDGWLTVFTAKEKRNDFGTEFPYKARTGYDIYDGTGRHVRHVIDNTGEYEDRPPPVALRPGHYRVEAMMAAGYGEWVSARVVIEAGRTTEAHLNGQWRPPPDTPPKVVVRGPAGFPVGWQAGGGPEG